MENNLIKYAKKENIELEIYATTNNEITIEYLNDQLTNYKSQDIKEYRIKALIDGASVKITTYDISNPKEIIEDLQLARTLIDELDNDSLAKTIEIENRNINEPKINTQEIKNKIVEFNNEIKMNYSNIHSIRTEFNYEKNVYEISNTDGVKIKDSNYHSYYSSYIVIKNDKNNLSCYEYLIAKEINFEKFKNKVNQAIENTLIKKDAKSIITNKYNIILSNKVTYNILKEFVVDFHASNINKKLSVFSDKLNEKIFSDKITIVEDPTNSNLFGARLFDSEGIKTSYKKIIENGIFTTKIYNKKYAAQDNVQSTGNAFGVRNAYILPGNKKLSDLLKELNDGILIDEVSGLHSGINHLTGSISLQCEGYILKNGKISKGVKQIILSTNIFELFNNVKEIGNDLEFFGSIGGAPSLLIENITIAGKEV